MSRECGKAEYGSEALRMYIKIDAFTKRKLPTQFRYERSIEITLLLRRERKRESKLSYRNSITLLQRK